MATRSVARVVAGAMSLPVAMGSDAPPTSTFSVEGVPAMLWIIGTACVHWPPGPPGWRPSARKRPTR